jgi:hypothetical protein
MAQPFELGEGVTRAAMVEPYEWREGDPLSRPLKVFALDPAASRLEGSIATVAVPYEPLSSEPGSGIVGRMFRIMAPDDDAAPPLDLDDPKILIAGGLDPTPFDRRFHQQMVYAVCATVYAAVSNALGRPVAWGFDGVLHPRPPGQWQLRVYPCDAASGQNASYDHMRGELRFGYYRGDKKSVKGDLLPAGLYYTCLSHDIVVHEVTHALLDGLRARFTLPTHPDVTAFHEGFCDLVALFHRFSYPQVVRAAILRSGGDLRRATLLTDLATEFGQSTGHDGGKRTAIDAPAGGELPRAYSLAIVDPHELGLVLVSAVFEAFTTVFRRKTRRYFDLAGDLSGRCMPAALTDILAEQACRLASQFLAMCIRAIDYCPPVDLRFGEYLRALITADHELVPDDRWGHREALIDAFRRRAIFPEDVDFLSEDALLWRGAETPVSIRKLSFANLRFEGDPQHAAGSKELIRQACALGEVVTRPELRRQFGLAAPSASPVVDKPVIESIRSARRAGPHGRVLFDLVAEVTQRRVVRDARRGDWDFYGGSTVVLNPRGEVRYVIRKRVDHEERLKGQRRFRARR